MYMYICPAEYFNLTEKDEMTRREQIPKWSQSQSVFRFPFARRQEYYKCLLYILHYIMFGIVLVYQYEYICIYSIQIYIYIICICFVVQDSWEFKCGIFQKYHNGTFRIQIYIKCTKYFCCIRRCSCNSRNAYIKTYILHVKINGPEF